MDSSEKLYLGRALMNSMILYKLESFALLITDGHEGRMRWAAIIDEHSVLGSIFSAFVVFQF